MTESSREAQAAASPLIQAQGLSKSYGPIVAVRDLSFEVMRGEILGLLGPNGAGKSTTLRMLIGFQYPDAGTVRMDGHDVFREGTRARRALGYLPEILPLYAEASVREYLEYFGALKSVERIEAAIARVVEELDLSAVQDRPCGNLSRGYRQRVGLAQALLSSPSILILDEPTAGLDPNQIQDFRRLIRELGRDRAILLSTHILPEALEICDRVLILNKGSAVASGNPQSIGSDDQTLHWARLRCGRAPSDAERARFGLVAEIHPEIYRLSRELDREGARELLALALSAGWELLEWHVGATGLEAAFRRLTLGEEVT
ncbi:MAG: ABC transporter ATP-binding protein [Candidatus Eisenbacteria bacterium]